MQIYRENNIKREKGILINILECFLKSFKIFILKEVNIMEHLFVPNG